MRVVQGCKRGQRPTQARPEAKGPPKASEARGQRPEAKASQARGQRPERPEARGQGKRVDLHRWRPKAA